MLSKNLSRDFLDSYKHNENQLREWNDRLFEKTTPTEWIKLLTTRSEAIRKIYLDNTKLLKELSAILSEELSDEEYDNLYDMAYELYSEGYVDFSTLAQIGAFILPYYSEGCQYGKILFLNHLLGYVSINFHRFDSSYGHQYLNYFRNAIAQKDHFSEIEDPNIRSFIIKDYANLFFGILDSSEYTFEDAVACNEEMHAFFHSEAVQNLDGQNPLYPAILYRVDASLMEINVFEFNKTGTLTPTNKKVLEKAEKLLENFDEINCDITELISKLYCDFMRGRIGKEDMLRKIITRFNQSAPAFDITQNKREEVQALSIYLSTFCEILTVIHRLESDQESRKELLSLCLPQVLRMVSDLPYTYFPEILNQNIVQIYHDVQPYLIGKTERIETILSLLVRRQPVTYIHSMMVSKIATLLLSSVFVKCPEELVGICGYQTIQEVLSHKQELTNYVVTCAMLHDVGKCDITDVINRQNRSLTEDEFLMIQNHPEQGSTILGDSGELAPYLDVIRGHHKFYDGSKGYPADFDHTASPVRFIIDLIAIADSTDAATDILGRNYTKGKDFSQLFTELKEGAGTRYNPCIVQLLEDDTTLQNELSHLTSEGRYDVYYQAYHELHSLTQI